MLLRMPIIFVENMLASDLGDSDHDDISRKTDERFLFYQDSSLTHKYLSSTTYVRVFWV